MPWLQLEFEIEQIYAEEFSFFLEQLGATAISLSASSNEAIFDEGDEENLLWDKTHVEALFDSEHDVDSLIIRLNKFASGKVTLNHKIKLLEDRDWVDEFKSEYQPLFFLDKICISPSWHEQLKNKIPTIILDPGLAFGTGAHPTTSLCIEWFCVNDINNKIVIDYGCGSGILSMVAAKLGAKKVYAIDIDEGVLKVAGENIKNNKLEEIIVLGKPENLRIPKADILVANILKNPLIKLFDKFSRLTKSGGHLVLSGIVNKQVDECLSKYKSNFNMDKPVLRESWASLHGARH